MVEQSRRVREPGDRGGDLKGIFSFLICACGRHARFERWGLIIQMVASKAAAHAFVRTALARHVIDPMSAALFNAYIVQSSLVQGEECVDPDVRRRVQAANVLFARMMRKRRLALITPRDADELRHFGDCISEPVSEPRYAPQPN